eukprot:1135036-Prorocentrum_minimum.AAC.1
MQTHLVQIGTTGCRVLNQLERKRRESLQTQPPAKSQQRSAAVSSGQQRVSSGQQRVSSGQQIVSSGQQRVSSGEQRVSSGQQRSAAVSS